MKRTFQYLTTLLAFIIGAALFGPRVGAQVAGYEVASATCPFGTLVTSTGPTALATTPGITTKGGQTVSIQGSVLYQAATGSSGVALYVVRGSGTGGAKVITPTTVSSTAQAAAPYTFFWDDAPGEVAGQQYTLVISPTGGSANGTAQTCEMMVEAH